MCHLGPFHYCNQNLVVVEGGSCGGCVCVMFAGGGRGRGGRKGGRCGGGCAHVVYLKKLLIKGKKKKKTYLGAGDMSPDMSPACFGAPG